MENTPSLVDLKPTRTTSKQILRSCWRVRRLGAIGSLFCRLWFVSFIEHFVSVPLCCSCSMALSAGLESAGKPAKRVETKCFVTIDKVGAGFSITKVRLVVKAEVRSCAFALMLCCSSEASLCSQVPGITKEAFLEAAKATKDGCPISKVMKGNVQMELDAQLL